MYTHTVVNISSSCDQFVRCFSFCVELHKIQGCLDPFMTYDYKLATQVTVTKSYGYDVRLWSTVQGRYCKKKIMISLLIRHMGS